MKRRDFLKITAGAGAIPLLQNVPLYGVSPNNAQNDVSHNALPVWKGFNLLEKFTHKPDEWLSIAPHWGYNNEPFKESDFAAIKELGFNFVRLPMSYKCWSEENDWYKLKEKPLKEIDQAVEWGKQYGIHVCINFHRAPGFTICDSIFKPEHKEKTNLWGDEKTVKAFAFHWRHFAERYRGIPSSRLSFNLLNEPVTSQGNHDRVMRHVISEIRRIDPARLIMIDGCNFAPSFTLTDLNLVQCPRGYEPSWLTHYETNWAGAKWTGVPAWPSGSWNKKHLQRLFNPWKDLEAKGSGVFVAEFGVYNRTPHAVTLAFLKDNVEVWKEHKWGYALWNFRGTFGVADSGRSDVNYENYKGFKLDRKMVEVLHA